MENQKTESEKQDKFLGMPVGKELSVEAFIHDIWNPQSEEIIQPKRFIGLGWGINLYAVAKKIGLM